MMQEQYKKEIFFCGRIKNPPNFFVALFFTVINKFLFAILLFLSLQGCVGTAMTGASAVYNHYTIEHQVKNQETSFHLSQVISQDPEFTGSDISVASFNYQVLLVGQTSSEKLRQKAAALASNAPYVKHVYNFITIEKPISVEQCTKDDWITTQIKSKMIASDEIDPNKIKVVTEDSTVYLLGYVTHKQADIAVNMARNTTGVKQVVKIFKYIVIVDK